MSFTPEYTFMAAGVLRVVFVYDLAPGVLLTISLTLSVLGSIVEQAFGPLPRLCFLLAGFLLSAFMFGVVLLASDGRSLRWHHHLVFPSSFLVGLERTRSCLLV